MTPRLPQRTRPATRPGVNTGFWFGIGSIIAVVVGFMALLTAILPDAIFLFVVLFGFLGIIGLHYITWGRWLSQSVSQEPQPEEEPWPEAPLPGDE